MWKMWKLRWGGGEIIGSIELVAYIIKNEGPSLLSRTYNTIHPWPRKETELSATVQANLITQRSGTSKILVGDRTVPTVQTLV